MANANHVRGEKSDLPGSPSVSRGPQVEDVLLRELEEELQCHGCRKEHGKMSCAACGTSSYCGRECQVKDWQAGHKAKCKLLKKACENVDSMFSLKHPPTTLPELQKVAQAFEIFTSMKARTHRHFYKTLVLLIRVMERPSRMAQGYTALWAACDEAASMSQVCHAFMTRHAKRLGTDDEGQKDVGKGKTDAGRFGKLRPTSEVKAEAERQAKLAADNEEIRTALSKLPVKVQERRRGASSETGGLQLAKEVNKRCEYLQRLDSLYGHERHQELAEHASAQLQHLLPSNESSQTPGQESSARHQQHKSLELAAYLSMLGAAYVNQRRVEEGVKLLHDGIRMFEDKDLPSSPIHPLRVPRDHRRYESLPKVLLALHAKAYIALARATSACGHLVEARVILEKALKVVEARAQGKRFFTDRLPILLLGCSLQEEVLKVLFAKGDYLEGIRLCKSNEEVLRGFLKEAYRLDAGEWALNSLNDMLASVLIEHTRCSAYAHLHDETIEAADGTFAFIGSLEGAADYNQLMGEMRHLKADAQVGLDRVEDAINTLEIALKEVEAVPIPGGICSSGLTSPTSSADGTDSRGSSDDLKSFLMEARHYQSVQLRMQIGVSLHRLYSHQGADDKARHHIEKTQALVEEEKGSTSRWKEQLCERMNASTRGDSAFGGGSLDANGAYAMGRSEVKGPAAAKAAPRGQKNVQDPPPASNATFVAPNPPESSQNASKRRHWSRESSETAVRESEAEIAMPTAFVAPQAAETTSSGPPATSSPFAPSQSTYVPSATSAFRSSRPSPGAESMDEPAPGRQMDDSGSARVQTTTATTASSLSPSTDGRKSKNDREACLQYSDPPVPSLPLVNSRFAPPAPPAVLSEISSMVNNAPIPPAPSTTPSSMFAEVGETEANSALEVPDNKGKKDNTTVVSPPPVRAEATSPQLSATLDTATIDGPSAGPVRCSRRPEVVPMGGVLTT